MGRVITVVNQKGGVGKTTTAVNLAAGLALAERRTLLIDLDPQGNATTGLGVSKSELTRTIYHVLMEGVPLVDVIRPTAITSLGLVPSDIDLVGAEIELVAVEDREGRLKEVVKPTRGLYEYIIVDCPPSLGLLTLNALATADAALVPLQCEYYAMEGLAHILKTIGLVRERLNPGLEIEGIVLTMFDGRTSLATQVKAEVQRHLGSQILTTIIPRNVRLTEAPSFGKPIMLYDLRSPGSVAYLELTKEVLAHD
ncbi:MAG: sporulation initiation inhibitor Soj [Candidatus Rokuibacteriota bacterium]|nr:MAG: sporulation initiation inhibitor Soj [Candidatus Rokubacteria bacterium]